jgi:hypothetical protein
MNDELRTPPPRTEQPETVPYRIQDLGFKKENQLHKPNRLNELNKLNKPLLFER